MRNVIAEKVRRSRRKRISATFLHLTPENMFSDPHIPFMVKRSRMLAKFADCCEGEESGRSMRMRMKMRMNVAAHAVRDSLSEGSQSAKNPPIRGPIIQPTLPIALK